MNTIEIYTTRLCAACYVAKDLLIRQKMEFREVDVSDDPELRKDMARRAGGDRSVPQIFVAGRHIGDLETLEKLLEEGKFDSIFRQ